MSETNTITDDQDESIQTNTPYYDLEIGEHIFFELNQDENTLTERDVISGDAIHSWDVDTFKQECIASEYRELPSEIINNPQTVLENVLNSTLLDRMDRLNGYELWEVRFAIKATNMTRRKYAIEHEQ